MTISQGLYSLNVKTPHRQISWSLEAARLDAIIGSLFWTNIYFNMQVLTGIYMIDYKYCYKYTYEIDMIGEDKPFITSFFKTSI